MAHAATDELVPTGAGFARLEAEVERRRRLGLLPQHTRVSRQEFQTVGDLIRPELEAMLRRHNIDPSDMERAEREMAEREVQERARQEQERRQARWHKLCPPKFREVFDYNKVPERVKRENLDAVLKWQYGPKGLFIIGKSGLAKTTTMFAMLKRIAIDENRSTVVMDGIAFASACSVAFRDGDVTVRWLREMLKPDVLVIDDLAKRFTPATQQGFFAVLDRRTSHNKPLIITTNVTGDMLEAMIDEKDRAGLAEPLRRRLRQYCHLVLF